MENNKSLLRYAGLATQFFVVIGLTVFAGLWLDKKLSPANPLMVWIIPLVFIIFIIYKIVKDTSPAKK